MIFTRVLFTALAAAAAFSTTSAMIGRATIESLGTTPCPAACTQTDFRVALPAEMFPNGENCCQPVVVTYQGTSVGVIFTDLYLAAGSSYNISLSHQAFQLLAPLEIGQIYPVDWELF